MDPAGRANAGLAAATTELVAFVDSDCAPCPGWLDPLRAALADPLVALAAPRIVAEPGPGWLARYEASRSPLDRGPLGGLVRPRTRIPFVPSAALVARRSALGEAPFDETLRGGEDVDLVWRLVEAGWDVRYVPDSQVAHGTERSRLGPWLTRRVFYASTAGPLARRHPGRLAPVAVSAWTAATWALVAGRRPLAAAAVLGTSTAILARRLAGTVERPWPLATRISVGGTVRSVVPMVEAVDRAYGPLLMAGLASRRLRWPAAAVLVAPALHRWWVEQPTLDPLRYTAAHVADNLAYAVGLWAGSARARTAEPLVPEVALASPEWTRRAVRVL